MFRKKIFGVVIPIIIGMCISVIPYQENMAGETSNKSVSVQSSGEPSGDAQVISEETEDIDEIELYAVGEKDISQTEFIKSLLSKVGKGYSQSKRYEENYYDCSSLVMRCLQEFGLTGIPISTAGWNSRLAGTNIGDIITFHGNGCKASYKLIAKNTDIISNPDAFVVPGTLMVLILPNESRGHIAVSLGAFDRQEGEYDPAENPQGVLQTTMEYVTGLLEQRYGVGQDLLLGLNSITQYPNTWMEKKYLGTDILLDDGTYSGEYNKIWRVEAYSDSTGVCVTNAAKGTNGLNAKYVLLPVTENTNLNSNTNLITYQEKNSIDDIQISDITSDGYQINVTVTASSGIKQVLMPTWTVKNGQDDIVWHKASVNGKVASVKIPASQHKSEAGEYITHIYLYTNSGNVLVKSAYVDLTDCSQAVSFDHKHGWEFVDGKWYYYNARREKSTGFIHLQTNSYYLDDDGVMMTGWQKINEDWYYFHDSGAMVTGWYPVGDHWYYFDENGKMKTGWLQSGEDWYYLYDSGAMISGWYPVGDHWYYFDENGKMKTGWLQSGEDWYYLYDSGAMISGWYPVGDHWYYFDENGKMKTGWLQLNGDWYYLYDGGQMIIDWYLVGDHWYYFDGNGRMKTGIQVINGIEYNLGTDGAWIKPEENVG